MAQPNKQFADAFKVFTDFKAPVYDFNQLFSVGRRNIEAFTSANQAVAEGAQAVARRQAEIAKNSAEEAIQLFREVYSSPSPDAGAQKQADFVKSQFESALANAREVFEMISKSNSEAAEIITRRITEALGEANKAANTAGRKSNQQ